MLFTRRRNVLLVLAAALAGALVMTQTDVRFASSQNVTLVSRYTDQKVPLDDPDAAVWSTAFPVQLPLSMQMTAPPYGGGSVKSVTASSLHDGDRIYFRLQWADPTLDDSVFSPQQFRDAVAVEFPAPVGAVVPFFCMGQVDAHVNIWQWKADWQAQVSGRPAPAVLQAYADAAGADFYPERDDPTFYPARAVGNLFGATERTTPVENLVAGGFGTLTTATAQDVEGSGKWENGRWTVVFSRSMDIGGDYANLSPGTKSSAAFAVWDGGQGDRNGQKSVSSFVALSVGPAGPGGSGNGGLIVGLLGGLGGVAVGAFGLAMAGRYWLRVQELQRER